MPDPDIERLARFLATHALLLLGAGIVVATLTFAAVVAAVRAAAHLREPLIRHFSALVARAYAVDTMRRLLDRSATLVPSAYVALHLILGLVLVAASAVFVLVAEDTLGGGAMATFDVAFARALHAETSVAGLRAFETVSWLGSREVLTAVTLVVALVLVVKRTTVLAIGWVAAQAGGALLNLALKATFTRTRPEFADPILAASSWSFPSGHAMGTFIACGVGGYLLVRGSRSWLATSVVATVALSWCLVMAFSRLYLGVHYASDVVAGIVGGAAWVVVCVSALEVVHRRRRPSRVREHPARASE